MSPDNDQGIFVHTLRDGKIADQFFTYDTMRFISDVAQGDRKKVAGALVRMDAVMAEMKKGASGKPGFTARPESK